MLMTQNTNNLNDHPRKDRVHFWLLVAVSCLALAALLIMLPVWNVQADAVLSKPAVFLPPAPPVKIPQPILVEDHRAEQNVPKSLRRGVASWYGEEFHG